MSTKDRWIKIVEDWKKSGAIAKRWCEKHQISYVSFITWRKKLELSTSIKEKTSSFIEVVETDDTPCVVELKFQDFTLCLKQDFDERLVKRCLKLIKSL